MMLPVGHQAAQQVGSPQHRAVGRRRGADGHVIAAPGAGVPAVEHELFRAQPGRVCFVVKRRGVLHQFVPAMRGLNVDFENARIEYLRRLDWADFDPRAGIGPILASTEAVYRKPLTYPDTISIGSRIASVGEDRFIIEHRIVSHRLQVVTTEGRGTIVTFDYGTGKKVKVPEELRRKIATMEVKGHN